MSSLLYYVSAALLLTHHIQAAEFSIALDPNEKYNVTWSFQSTNPSDEITFTVTCETEGWVGLGFSPNGAMTGADIVVMWVDSQGAGHIKDLHATANSLPVDDNSQDYTLISAKEVNGISTFSFKRKLDTCDGNHDRKITSSTTRLIYAYGTKDPSNADLTYSDIHKNAHRGAKSIYLLDPPRDTNSVPANTNSFDITVKDYDIPSNLTTYYCSFHDPPTLDSKHHIIGVEPVIQPGNEALVHHIIVYACYGLSTPYLKSTNKSEGICRGAEMPEYWNACRTFVFAWAIGGTKYLFPEETGIPVGATDTPDYYLMETHYDNQLGVVDRKDSSGLRFFYTPTLRTYDTGNMMVGMVQGIFVPPKVKEFKVTAYCDSSCTNKWIPETGVSVFAYLLHAHVLGTGIKVEVYRDNKPLEILAEDGNYDFNYQEQRSFQKNKKLLPGDVLKITCTYDSSNRDQMTFGGEGTLEEMCLTFLMYYPKQDISSCDSIPGFYTDGNDTLYSSLSLQPQEYPTQNGTFYDFAGALRTQITDWTPEIVAKAQKAAQESNPRPNCIRDGFIFYTVGGEPVDPSRYPEIEETDNNDCNREQGQGVETSTQVPPQAPAASTQIPKSTTSRASVFLSSTSLLICSLLHNLLDM